MGISKTTAIILQNKPLFENERQLLIFSKDHGRFYVLAKPNKTKKSGFQGQFEATNVVDLVLFQGRSMMYVNHCDTIETFPNIRQEFNRIALVSYFFELIIKSTQANQPHEPLYELLLTALRHANDLSTSTEALMAEFHGQFLEREGIAPLQIGTIKEAEFYRIFENYTGKKVRRPNQVLNVTSR